MRTTVTVDSEKLNEVQRALQAKSKAKTVELALDEAIYRIRLAKLNARRGPWFKWDDTVLLERKLGHRSAAIRAWREKEKTRHAPS